MRVADISFPIHILDANKICYYNVVTMQTNIISIGNSKGIRIPKVLLQESGLEGKVEIKAKDGEIKIMSIPKPLSATAQISQQVLAQDWDKPEEDEAWINL